MRAQERWWPRRWHVVEVMSDGRVSICSSHRTRAAAVLAIPVRFDRYYDVMRPEQVRLKNASAVSWGPGTTSTEEA